jgi:myosin heavy subunit
MLLRISLILAILAGAGVIAVTQLKVRPHIQSIIEARNENEKKWQSELRRANDLKKKLTQTETTLQTTQKKLTDTERERDQAAARATEQEGRASRLQQDLDQTRTRLTEAQQKLSRFELTGKQPEEIKALDEAVKKFQSENEVLQVEAKVLAKRNADLQHRIDDLTGGDIDVALPAGLRGKVLVVDPKWSFVVLDVGRSKEVKANGVMLVSREGKLIGKIRIMSVQDSRSIANIMPGWRLGDVREGDDVVTMN